MKQCFLRLVIIFFSFFLSTMSCVVLADAPIDRIVAVVNDGVITQSQLDQQFRLAREQLQQSHAPLPTDAMLRQQVLQHLIDEQLQLDLAKKMNIKVSDADVDQAIAGIAQQNGLSVPDLQSKVVQQGMTYDQYRQQIRKQITISQLQQHEVAPRVTVNPQEVTDAMTAIAKQPVQKAAQYHLQDMVVPLPENPTALQISAAQKRAQDLVAKLRAGADFRQTVISGGTDKPPLQGGDLGWHKLTEMPDLFAAAVKNMQPGDIGGPIRAPNGFHIIKLVEMQGGNPLAQTIEQTHVRHILIKVTPLESDAAVQDRLKRLRVQVLNGVDFAKLATVNSQDPGSASKGGDLGWVTPGMLDPTFEAQMKLLKPGEVSQPFKTQFGWHIVQVLDRKAVQDKTVYLRQQAQQFIYQRKMQEALHNWVRGLRSQAYIKVL
jgi:peptidyl-prolyl cis-trans isomerase SurA